MKPTLRFDHVHYRSSSSNFEATRAFYVGIMEAIDLGTVELGGKPKQAIEDQVQCSGAAEGGLLAEAAPQDHKYDQGAGGFNQLHRIAEARVGHEGAAVVLQ